MKLFSEKIFPRLLDKSMSDKEYERLRPLVLAKARGQVLEIGSGSGLNLKYYPPAVTKIIALDVNPGMHNLARKQAGSSPAPVEFVTQNGEELPFEDESFDTVVSTWSLCSIERVEIALREIRRVLKPGGRFLFIEHGLAPDKKVQSWQHRLTPLQKRLSGNCHLDRPTRQLIENQGFKFEELREYYIENVPKLAGYTYQGVAYPS